MSKFWDILLASDGSAESLQAAAWLEANFTGHCCHRCSRNG